MRRITDKDLQAIVNRINLITNNPIEPWFKKVTKDKTIFRSNIGNYHLGYAYGGVTLHRMMNESGGIEDVLRIGYTSKRELYNNLHSFITGLEKGDK